MVGPAIVRRRQELRQQITVLAVQLHLVEAGPFGAPCAEDEVLHDLLDLRGREAA